MARRRLNPHALILPIEAERAIYIDFEGFKEKSPTLLGVLIEDNLEQVILDSALLPLANARGHRVSTLAGEAYRLVQRSADEKRLIVAYTQHERKVLSTFANTDIDEHYRDARMIAKRWTNALYPKASIKGRELKDFLKFIKFPRGAHLGYRKSTKRIRAARDMIVRKGSYEALTAVAKAKWTKLLQHNAIDCRGMQALVRRAAKEMAARSPNSSTRSTGQRPLGG